MENKDLLEIARQVVVNNIDFEAALTGSIMLLVRGIDIGRKFNDIDVIVYSEINAELVSKLWVPDGFIQYSPTYPDSVHFRNDILDVNIDFVSSFEDRECVSGLILGTVEELIKAKLYYIDNNSKSKDKHIADLKAMGIEYIPKVNEQEPLEFDCL